VIILGLTGSIGMGKSTAAKMLRRLGVPLYDADAEVHRLLATGGGAVRAVAAAFHGVCNDSGAIDRQKLGRRVFGDEPALRRLEAILHPLVRIAERRFVARARARRALLVVLDIPLLFETGGDRNVDAVVVVTCSPDAQRDRVLAREGMSPERLAAILAQQTPDAEKRARADFVLDTGHGLEAARAQVAEIIAAMRDPQRRPQRREAAAGIPKP
jgi:dephospho-CoA kinase